MILLSIKLSVRLLFKIMTGPFVATQEIHGTLPSTSFSAAAQQDEIDLANDGEKEGIVLIY